MNIRSLTVVLAALAASALGGCTVISGPGTTGSGGGATSATATTGSTSATTSTSGAGGATTTATSTTGTGMCDPAYTCVDAIAEVSGDPALLCDGPAHDQFDALATCTCTGACAVPCKDNACSQHDASAECKACLQTADTGCKKEFDNCVNGT